MKKMKGKSKYAGLRTDTRSTALLMGNPVWRALAKNAPVAEKAQTSIGLGARKSLYAMTNGDGQFAHFKELLITAFAGMYLAEQGFGLDLLGDFEAAVGALNGSLERARAGEKLSLTEPEAVKVGEMVGLHEQQIQMVDQAQLSAAIMESYRRISNVMV